MVTPDVGFISTTRSFAEAQKFDSFKPALLALIAGLASGPTFAFNREIEIGIATLVTAVCDPARSSLVDRILTEPRRNAFTSFDLMFGPRMKSTDPDTMEDIDDSAEEHVFWRLLQIYRRSLDPKGEQITIYVREETLYMNSHLNQLTPAGVAICYTLLRQLLMQTLARGQLIDAANIGTLFASITLQYANNDLKDILESWAVVEGTAKSAAHPLA